MTRLPRALEWLLRAAVPADLREPLAGDLHEEYLQRRATRGSLRTTLWLWSSAFRLALRFRWERASRGRALPPIGDELRRSRMWESFRQDLAFGARMLRRQPGFTAVALLALTLGIGANTAIFSIVDSVLWRPLPYRDQERLVSIVEQRARQGLDLGPVAPADFFDWRQNSRAFEAMAGYEDGVVNLTGTAEPQRLRTLWVSPSFLQVLGVTPARGRDFRAEEEIPGRNRVALLTDALWRRRFGADPAVVGRSVSLDGNAYQIVGVLPPTFWWVSEPAIVLPFSLSAEERTRTLHYLSVLARPRPGMTIDQTRADMNSVGRRIEESFPTENSGHQPRVVPLRDVLVGDVKPAMLALLVAVACVLLIACANVATLLLARASARQKELAVRIAIGAGRGRLIRQMLTESLLLGATGGVLGLVLARWIVGAVNPLLPDSVSVLPGIAAIGLDVRVAAAAAGISLVTSLMFGLIPAMTASQQSVGASLQEDGRSHAGSRRSTRMRSMLVVVELALSLILLAGAALLLVSYRNLRDIRPGFDPERVLTVRLSLPEARYPNRQRALAFFDPLLERLRALPGVQSAGAVNDLPFSGGDARAGFEIEGRTGDAAGPVRAHPRLATPSYLSTMKIPLVRGRLLSDEDVNGAARVALINATAARQYWPDTNPLGQRIRFIGQFPRWSEIVGVVGDVKHYSLEADAVPEIYISYPQLTPFPNQGRNMTIVVRTRDESPMLGPAIRAAVREIDADQPVGAIQAMAEIVDRSAAPQRLNLWLLTAFAGIAVVLTAAGLYGVMGYLVALRTREIGVRMALGATPKSVLALVLRQAGALTLIGIGLGVAGALASSRFLSTLLFGVRATEPAIYAAVAALLGVVALAAIAIPLWRVTRIDPLAALRA